MTVVHSGSGSGGAQSHTLPCVASMVVVVVQFRNSGVVHSGGCRAW